MKPVLQLALDFVDLPRALQVAEEAVAGGADWLEAGTPLIKSEGLQAVRELKARWPDHVVVADMKTMDAGRAEVECAAKAGAQVVGVLGRRLGRHHPGVRGSGPQLRGRDHRGHDPGRGRRRPRPSGGGDGRELYRASTSPSTSRCRARPPGTRSGR